MTCNTAPECPTDDFDEAVGELCEHALEEACVVCVATGLLLAAAELLAQMMSPIAAVEQFSLLAGQTARVLPTMAADDDGLAN